MVTRRGAARGRDASAVETELRRRRPRGFVSRAAGCLCVAVALSSGCAAQRAEPGPATATESPAPAPEPAGTPWEDARRRGNDFRAIGQEPGWFLEMDFDGTTHLATDYAQTHYRMPTPSPHPYERAPTATYAARLDDTRITVVIADLPCEDVMSGERFPHTVTVYVGDEELSGCGRYLTAARPR